MKELKCGSLPTADIVGAVGKMEMLRNKTYHKAEYNQRHVCFVNVQSFLHGNVIFSVCLCMGNATCITFIIGNSIFGYDAWYHFGFTSVAVWLPQ